uniref:Egg protein CP391S-like protein n=1 Tax=Schistosoma mansoni TaxID=6183 RepID=A0AA82N7S4_SCHMA
MSPGVPHKFEKLSNKKKFVPQLKFKFHSIDISYVEISPDGTMKINVENEIGNIFNALDYTVKFECEFSNEKELFAVRWSFFTKGESSHSVAKLTVLIQKNGKISLYYDDIPQAMNKFGKISTISALVHCGKGDILISSAVSLKWITTGTLVEYEVAGDCPKYKSHKECEDASTKDSVCLWCDKVSMCISSDDEDTHDFKVKGCRNEGSLNVSDPSEPTPNKQEETNEEDIEAESENDLKKTTEKHEPHVTV